MNNNGPVINISSNEYEVKNITLNIGKMTAKYDYSDQKTHYDYEHISCGSCDNSIPNITNALYNKDSVLDNIKQCSNCKKTFNEININTEQSYLYPKVIYFVNRDTIVKLYCSQCSNNCLADVYAIFDSTNNKYTNLSDYRQNWFDNHATKYGGCGISDNNLIYDPDYVLQCCNTIIYAKL